MKKLNRKDLVELLSEEAHLSKKEARNAIDITFGLMEKALLNGEEVNITNFGVFMPKQRQEREGTHPKQHNRIVIKSKRSVTFKLSKNLKQKLN